MIDQHTLYGTTTAQYNGDAGEALWKIKCDNDV